MHKIDVSQKPVYILHSIEPLMKEDAQAIIDMGEELIAANQPFALVIVNVGEHDEGRERGANAMMTQWVKKAKPGLERLCAGAASVVANSHLLSIYQPIMKTVGARMYGFPLELFTDIEEATQWARGQLERAKAG
ncbi:MAG: hypothetical protein KIS85_04005 [Anaerolineales bacterium]|nr:hypothetical protein [Anaerolineales bacterium]